MEVVRLEPDRVTPAIARFATATLLQSTPSPLPFNAQLLVSELVTNAIVHGAGILGVVLSLTEDLFVVEVADASSVEPRVLPPTLDEGGGRGMLLVDAIASAWSFRTTSTGKVVSAELRLVDS